MSIHVIHFAFRALLQLWDDFAVYRQTAGKAEAESVLALEPQHLAGSFMALLFDPADVTLTTTSGVRCEQVAGGRTATTYKNKFNKDPVKEKAPKQTTCMLPLVSDPQTLEKHWLCKWTGDSAEQGGNGDAGNFDPDDPLKQKNVVFSRDAT